MSRAHVGLFLAEGSSDQPLGALVVQLFAMAGVRLDLASPDFGLLQDRVPRDLPSRLRAGVRLVDRPVDVLVVHRDADRGPPDARRREMQAAVADCDLDTLLVGVVPVRMTEAWLLLDETAIRTVAGNPRGTDDLDLPPVHEAERLPDSKAVLQAALLAAADVTGRRRERLSRRFSQNRRLLLERLDPLGEVNRLASYRELRHQVDEVASRLR